MKNELKTAGVWADVEFFHIPNHSGYAVSRCGKVRSLDRVVIHNSGMKQRRKGIVLKTWIGSLGYQLVSMKRTQRAVHRLLGMTFLGLQPDQEIDHIDRNRSNNSMGNLRVSTRSENMHNRSFKGCSFHKPTGKWRAQICIDRKPVCLGAFENEADAISVYEKAKKEHLGWVPQQTTQQHER